MIDGIIEFIKANYGSPPAAYYFLALVSIAASLLYFIAQMYLVDRQKIRIYSEKVKKWQEKRKKAMKTGSKRLMLEVQKESEVITKMQSEMAQEQFKPLLIFFVPFMLLFWFIGNIYGNSIIMLLPFPLPIVGGKITAIWFYILFNIIVSSFLNTTVKIIDSFKRLKTR
jgi:uncharacterized membrane protein (DUF106 family)